jgi:hypothetical protein
MMLRHRHPTGLVSGQQEIEARSLDMGEHRAGNGGEHSRQRRDVELDIEDVGRLSGDAGDGGDQGGGERQPKLGSPQPSRRGPVSAGALPIELDLSVDPTFDILL